MGHTRLNDFLKQVHEDPDLLNKDCEAEAENQTATCDISCNKDVILRRIVEM